jgi:hypothetical protein
MKKGLSRRDFVKTAATHFGISAIGGIGAQEAGSRTLWVWFFKGCGF